MPPGKPLLGDVELQQVQRIQTEQDQVLIGHGVPSLEGDFLQRAGRRSNKIMLTGVLTGAKAGEGLRKLREKFRAAEPVPFVSDIVSATRLNKVLIEEMIVRELAGKPERFEYALTLREFIQPPANQTQEMEIISQEVVEEAQAQVEETVVAVIQNVGTLTVQVEIEDAPQDFTDIIVLVEGVSEAGVQVSFTIEEQVNSIYSRENVAAGEYAVKVFRR
jgi:hypothetical protein